MPVRLLSERVIDQIAAGEVVERPAAVVKELVENALDAGATRIAVLLRGGGVHRIRVIDDGSGMNRQDAMLSMERHATSKLTTLDDLLSIGTLGFRGEALPSIASVSRFSLTTRRPEDEVGTRIRLEEGKLLDVTDAGGPPGTEVDVRSLFGAVPARRKFLRSPATEHGHCVDALTRLALARPDVGFRLTIEDRDLWNVAPATEEARLAAMLGDERWIPVDGGSHGVRVAGFLAPPEVHRAAGGLFLVLDRRPVRDAVLRRAVLDGFRDLLPRGRVPVGLVRVSVGPGEVDVNAHPAKVEVRFRDPRGVTEAVVAAVRSALEGVGTRAVDPIRARAALRTAPVDEPAGTLALPLAPIRVEATPVVRPAPARLPAHPDDDPRPYSEPWLPAPLVVAEAGFAWRSLRSLGVVAGRWLVCDAGADLVLVDRLAVDRERLRGALALGCPARHLVAPVRVPLSPARREALLGAADAVGRWGLRVEPESGRDVVVGAVPDVAAALDVGLLAREMPLQEPEIGLWLAERCASPGPSPTPYEQRAALVALDEAGVPFEAVARRVDPSAR